MAKIDLHRIAQDCIDPIQHTLFGPDDRINFPDPPKGRGILPSVSRDLIRSTIYLPEIATHYGIKTLSHVAAKFGINGKDPNTKVDKHEPAALFFPGYFGPNAYLDRLAGKMGLPPLVDPACDSLRLTGNIHTDATRYLQILETREAPMIAIGHSRGGPVALEVLRQLQARGLDELITATILLSPISSGTRKAIGALGKILPSQTVRDMLPGSQNVSAWEKPESAGGLRDDVRERVLVIIPRHGDAFAHPDQAVVRGGTLILTPDEGHLEQVVDPHSQIFQLTVKIGKKIHEKLLNTTEPIALSAENTKLRASG